MQADLLPGKSSNKNTLSEAPLHNVSDLLSMS